MKKRRWGRKLLVAAGCLVGLAVLGVLGLWIAVHRKPGWYQPASVAPADYQRVRDAGERVFQEISDTIILRKPFEYVLTERQINEWISIRHAIWPESGEWIPDDFQNPSVAFRPGRMILAATVSHSGVEVVAGVQLNMAADESEMVVSLAGVSGGSLPIPFGILAKPLHDELERRGLLGKLPNRKSPPPEGQSSADAWLSALKEGISFSNRFVWPNGKRKFRIVSISFEDGLCRMRILPE